MYVGLEIPLRACPHLFFRQPVPLLLRLLGTLGGIGVADIQGLPRHQNITEGAQWLREFDLLQYSYGFPHAPV